MFNHITNVLNGTPDYLIGLEGGNPVLVPQARNSLYSWASRPDPVQAGPGAEILVGDIGNVGAVRLRSDGTIWRLAGPVDLFVDTSPVVGVANTSEQVLKTYTFQAGLFTALRYFSVKTVFGKSGTSETLTMRLRFGTGVSGGLGDTQVASTAILTTTNRTMATETLAFASSPTQLRLLGAAQAAGFSAALSSGVYPQNATIPDMGANAIQLSITAQMSAGAEQATAAHIIVTGY